MARRRLPTRTPPAVHDQSSEHDQAADPEEMRVDGDRQSEHHTGQKRSHPGQWGLHEQVSEPGERGHAQQQRDVAGVEPVVDERIDDECARRDRLADRARPAGEQPRTPTAKDQRQSDDQPGARGSEQTRANRRRRRRTADLRAGFVR